MVYHYYGLSWLIKSLIIIVLILYQIVAFHKYNLKNILFLFYMILVIYN